MTKRYYVVVLPRNKNHKDLFWCADIHHWTTIHEADWFTSKRDAIQMRESLKMWDTVKVARLLVEIRS
jgi:hypothetical protein